jgi:glutamine phosphoribosylpyrophosphate amidotransferase
MCSIIGYNSDVYDKLLVESICQNSRVRGLHAFGYYFLDEKKRLKTEKFLNYNEFINSLNKKKPTKFIAHFRYSTSGDYKNHENNQPIVLGGCSMVFNGVVDMGNKQQMEQKYNVRLATENDGELVLINFLKSEKNMVDFVKDKTFAGLFLIKGKIYAFTNSKRPAYLGVKDNVQVICSTKDILNRSLVYDVQELKINEILVL